MPLMPPRNEVTDREGGMEINRGSFGEQSKGRGVRGRRRKWDDELDTIMLKEVVANEAHAAPYGHGRERYQCVANLLNVHSTFVRCAFQTDWKHTRDKFKLVLERFENAEKTKIRTSGIEEEYGKEGELLMDTLADLEEHNRDAVSRREPKSS